MHALRQLLRWSFAVAVALFFPAAIAGLLQLARRDHPASPFAHLGVCAVFLVVSFFSAMAWWTTRKPRSTRPAWAIAASAINLATGLIVLRFAYGSMTLSGPGLLPAAIGVTGLIVFSRRETVPAAPAQPDPASDAIAWREHAAAALFVIAQLAAVHLWSGWVYSHALPADTAPTNARIASIVLTVLAALTTSTLHEFGHALVAWAFNRKLLKFNAGPFQWRRRDPACKQDAGWNFKFHAPGMLTLGGAVSVEPGKPTQPRWHDICVVAAGPFANICVGLLALWAALRAHGTFYAPTWEFLALIASFCLIAAVFNLFPFQAERGTYSDGARIFQLLTSGMKVT
jgi:Zn-dependent protease